LAAKAEGAEPGHCPEGWVFKADGQGDHIYSDLLIEISGITVNFKNRFNGNPVVTTFA
jgi:hypothetical protein